MSFIDAYNAAFLLAHPEYARKMMRPKRPRRPKVIVMSIKPKYAKAIYEGRKHWEFRKAPPPLYTSIYLYESAPVSAVTGRLLFSESVTGIPDFVYDIVTGNRCFSKNLTGITRSRLRDYAGKKLVTALRVYEPERFDHPIPFEARPPQNWGRFDFVSTEETKMTKAEQIKLLEAELKAQDFELEKANAKIEEYRRKTELFAVAVHTESGCDGEGRFYDNLTIRIAPAPYGSANYDHQAFCKALDQFLVKWNEVAIASCTQNEYKKKQDR